MKLSGVTCNRSRRVCLLTYVMEVWEVRDREVGQVEAPGDHELQTVVTVTV